MKKRPGHYCSDKGGCGECERLAELRAEHREEGEQPTEREYDQLEAGAWWNYPPGMEPRRGW